MMVVILAGGQGTRLWPLSRRHRPKQFCRLLGEEEMIVQCYNRLRALLPAKDIYLSILPEFTEMAAALLPNMDARQFIVEPCRRDSGPAMAYAALKLSEAGRADEPVMFVPTDHYIENESLFLATLKLGADLVAETGKLVDIGVWPQGPSSELGYTRIGKRLETRNHIEVYEFLGHKEKPSLELAREYLASGNYLWHANYYMWTPQALLNAFAAHAPEIYEPLMRLSAADGKAAIYATLPRISMDYAVTEKLPPDQVLILKGTFGWSDIGAWNVLGDVTAENDFGAGTPVKHLSLDSKNCVIYSQTDKLIATIGLEDLVIVETADALLICPRDRAQDVKKLVDQLDTDDYRTYL